jgi:parvulin-like peptidyl-prolyl isomerase
MNRTIRIVCVLLAAVLLVGVTGCGSKDQAATVNGETIKKTEIDTQLAQLKTQYPQLFQGKDGKQREADFRKRLLDNAVNQMLIKQEAEKQGVAVSDADIQKQIDELTKNFGSEAAFQDALKKNNMTLDKLKEQEKIQLETQKLLDKLTKGITISEKEMRDYYDKNKAMFVDKASVHAAHILFEEKDKAAAEKALAQVKANPAMFSEIAKKDSKDPGSAAKGGDLGWPTTPYVPEFQKALDQTPAGQLAPSLVHTQFGWHIIKVIEKRKETTKSFAQVKDQVKQILTQQRQADVFQKMLDDLKKKAKIEYPKS